MTKDYKKKFQSLWLNLKDPHNPDLRARVLRGELEAARLVRMSATELASRVGALLLVAACFQR